MWSCARDSPKLDFTFLKITKPHRLRVRKRNASVDASSRELPYTTLRPLTILGQL